MTSDDELRARCEALERALGQVNGVVRVKLGLTENMGSLLNLLVTAPRVSDQMIRDLGIATGGKVAVYRLRAQMRPHGMTIESRRGVGYWLTPEVKQQL